tara:strand:- start:3553 stop:3759 length:207 start_codon:yes stop_codon:yes gene_type:complete
MSDEEIAILALQTTNAELIAAVNVTKGNIQASIDAAVAISENATIIPLANSVTNLITTQTMLINILNS